VIRLDNIDKGYGSQVLFIEASCALFRGEKAGLVGPNGAGKSTVFRMMVGEDEPDNGRVIVEKGVRIGYFHQQMGEMQGQSVLQATLDGCGPVSEVAARLREIEHQLADPANMDDMDALIHELGEAQSRFEKLDGYALEARAREILAGLRFSSEWVDQDVGALSGGWKMRVGLARILLMRPDVLLLDEPTNHLDLESILWLEGFLKSYEGALMMTSHDREFMNRVVNKIVEIDSGQLHVFTGNYDFYAQQRAILDSHAESEYERQQAMLAKEEAFIARFKARASHAAQVQSRVKKLEKIERVQPPKRRKKVRFHFPDPPRSGEDVVRLEHVRKGYGSRVIYQDFDFVVRRRERWCVMGVNGAGKSTLLKLVTGSTPPDEGRVALGPSVKMGYFAQHSMEVLRPDESVWESLIREFPQASIGSLRSLAGAFGFPGDEVEKKIRILSGGEKARLVLAQMLYDPPNFLVLDEPTNHLDVDTKEMLIDSLQSFEGSMLFVSHDRHFLHLLSNRVLELDGGRATVYDGGYTEYVAQTGYEGPT
jgi:ATPase subunit of ABC transporter with duplicated ATPase domains